MVENSDFFVGSDVRESYGCDWPAKADQTTRELKCFLATREGSGRGRMLDPATHAERAARLIWSPKDFTFEAKAPGNEGTVDEDKVYENFFSKATLKALCENREVIISGSASSSKTMPSSAYALLSFFADPLNTMVILSTTSLRGADTRAWSQVRDLFDKAQTKVGYAVEHIKAIVFDPSFELGGKRDVSQRDLRNGIMVLAVPPGAEGKGAVKNIIGLKNRRVIWIVDEMPEMTTGIMEEPVANLESNPYFQFVGLGNAKGGMNPHRQAAEPKGGWEGFDPCNRPFGGVWATKSGGCCLFLDGHKSPNMFPELREMDEKRDLPFPFLSNHITNERNALRYGHGDAAKGEKTAPYLRMCRGLWPDNDTEQTVLSFQFVTDNKGDGDVLWGPGEVTQVAALDPAFTSGGDSSVLVHGEVGTAYGDRRKVLKILGEYELNPASGKAYEDALAEDVVQKLDQWGVKPENFALDISSDGGKIAQAIMKLQGSTDLMAISSMGQASSRPVSSVDARPSNEAYDRRVTELWFSMRIGIEVGVIKGFDTRSGYAKDLFSRIYDLKGNDRVGILSKRDLKRLIGRSPDFGDAACYLLEIARHIGLDLSIQLDKEAEPVEVWTPGEVVDQDDYDGYSSELF
jgi:hypothetical protein